MDLVEILLQARMDGETSTVHEGLPQLVEGYLNGEEVSIPKKGGGTPDANAEDVEDTGGNDDGGQDEGNAPPPEEGRTAKAKAPGGGERSQHEALTDTLMDISGQFAIAVDSAEDNRTAMRRVSNAVGQLRSEVNGLLGSLGERMQEAGLVTAVESLTHVREGLRDLERTQMDLTDNLEHENAQLKFLSEDLSRHVNRARLVPLSTLFETYRRQARDLSKELGKDCAVSIRGGNTRIDRGVMNAVKAPLNHILRNAIDHGIEPPGERLDKGKPPQGTVKIQASTLGGGQVRISIEDDGRGMTMEQLRRRALDGGHTTDTIWRDLSDHERIQFLFLPGFSTASTVSDTSGRGFGLDIVKTDIEAIGGRVEIDFADNAGARILLTLPLNLALTRCVLANVGEHAFFGEQHVMFPLNEIEQIVQVGRDDLRKIEGREAVALNGDTMPVHDMAAVMALKASNRPIEEKQLIVLSNDESRHALVVEKIIDERNIVSRAFDARLGKLHYVRSSALMRDGSVALLADVAELLLSFENGQAGSVMHTASGKEEDEGTQSRQAHVLVVEDSATVREVERHMLEEAGYKVTTAVNGSDALNKLRGVTVDLVITDIDMPVMNGIELIGKIRAHERLSQVPIIVVSYKDRDQDRDRAIGAGADHYLTKGAFDSNQAMELVAQTVAS